MFSGAVAQQFPKNTGMVNDFANIIPDDVQQQLEENLREFNGKTSIEIAVVTVNSLDGMVIEDYAARLFKEWGIGKKDNDNGVLFLVAMREKKMRIETGYGIEPFLTDATCGRIINDQIVPIFKSGAYASGIALGIKKIIEKLEQAHTEEPEALTSGDKKVRTFKNNSEVVLIVVLVILLLVIVVFVAWFDDGTGGSNDSGGGFISGSGFSSGGSDSGGGFSFGGGSSGGGGASGGW